MDTSFIQKHLKSWNEHLKRISPFLVLEKGVWWESTSSGYHFHDADTAQDSQTDGPQLLHYRSATLKDVTIRQSQCWEKLVKEKIELPTPKLYIYTSDGHLDGEITYPLTDNCTTETAQFQTLEDTLNAAEAVHSEQRDVELDGGEG